MIGRELGIFLAVGSLTVLIDFLIYQSLIWSQLIGVDEAKGVGFITGTVFAYFANRFWTFGHKRLAAGSAWRFALLYAITLSTNVVINSMALSALITVPGSVQLAFLIATAVSATMNFVGMKSFVFKAASPLKLT
jgi:putative flippase GtrA